MNKYSIRGTQVTAEDLETAKASYAGVCNIEVDSIHDDEVKRLQSVDVSTSGYKRLYRYTFAVVHDGGRKTFDAVAGSEDDAYFKLMTDVSEYLGESAVRDDYDITCTGREHVG